MLPESEEFESFHQLTKKLLSKPQTIRDSSHTPVDARVIRAEGIMIQRVHCFFPCQAESICEGNEVFPAVNPDKARVYETRTFGEKNNIWGP